MLRPRCGPILALLVALLLSGCWGAERIESTSYVLAVGIDQAANHQLAVTVQLALPQHLGGGGGGGGMGGGGTVSTTGPGALVQTVDAPSLAAALRDLAAISSRVLDIGHARILLVSQSVAASGLAPVLDQFLRQPDFRRSEYMAVTADPPSQILQVQPVQELNPEAYLEFLLTHSTRYGAGLCVSVRQFAVDMADPDSQPVLPLLRLYQGRPPNLPTPPESLGQGGGSGGGSGSGGGGGGGGGSGGGQKVPQFVQVDGAVVFRGDRLVGTMTTQQAALWAMLENRVQQLSLAVPDPLAAGYVVELALTEVDSKSSATITGTAVAVTTKLSLEGLITNVQSGVDYSRSANLQVLQRAAEAELTTDYAQLIEQSQHNWRADVFRFGLAVRRRTWTWNQWQSIDWVDRYPDAAIRVDVRLRLPWSGLEGAPVAPHH